ncbi:MAG: tRNA-dihydrouridine synthase family protein [Candidatus Helarchaeota archaeon]|nr:tRNA-dihydrouridine synthase family protein [Candidatus Helarchaeota archaeon]
MKIKNLTLSSKTVLAPLANFSDHAFRILCRRFQAALVFTQKFNINALVNNFNKYQKDLEVYPEEHPISIQLIGEDPQILAKAMDLLKSYDYDAFDLNLGWPAPDALRYGLGGALLKHPEKISQLMSTIVNATNKVVSAKIRIGYDKFSINALEIAKIIEREGADFLTIHGRTVAAGYSGEVNFDVIQVVKETVNIPIIGNGDIVDSTSAKRMLKKTKCDLIMLGRAAMKNPRIFSEINESIKGRRLPPLSQEEHRKILQEYDALVKRTNSSQSRNSPFFRHNFV